MILRFGGKARLTRVVKKELQVRKEQTDLAAHFRQAESEIQRLG